MSHLSESQPAHVRPELERGLLVARWHREQLELDQLRAAVDVMVETGRTADDFPGLRRTGPRSPEDDPARIRGLPAVGRLSLGSAQPGSRPGDRVRRAVENETALLGGRQNGADGQKARRRS